MPDYAALLPMVLLLLVIGGFAGVIAGLLGVGGGIVLVPAFYFTFTHLGYDSAQIMQVCVATSLATIVFTSIRSVMAHNRKGAVDWSVLKSWAPWIVVGAIGGMLVAAQVDSTALLYVFGVLGLVVGVYMLLGRQDWRLGTGMPTGAPRGIMAMVVGFLSVLMGIGGGTFGVPLMTLYSQPIHRAVATASGFGIMIAAPSVLGFLFLPIEGAPPYTLGAVNTPAFLIVMATTMTTTTWGVKLAHAMDPKPLKRVFGAFLILVALNMLRKAAGW
ncbi:MAG: hypothetical protein DI533_03990 [Cereibacter sphaeroides]|uniref:Probable membrane transporter protein n=1 Tax=Cereibacter sphaeroides TaxID=1063 RepID=A0A2W5SJD2_CERSP|nr:MAG: hypothetical protein DI533_03990 [Cereibacter sphaeroides]